MSIANLVVELELKDGKYHSGMVRARKDADNLAGSLGGVSKGLGRIGDGATSSIPKIRDLAIITASLHSIFATANDTVGAFVKSLVEGNAEIERTKVLLMGLSKSADTQGKIADAAKDMQFLFDAAKNTPFALKEISNSFVKMKTVGLSDVEGKVRNLTDAIANFGGDDQTLHRATVAIQQMASKGVISMEELRQQLGEAVPSAMQAMADGMGMTIGKLVEEISKGKVKAIPAIEAMMREMELTMAGSSSRMMNTWNGMVSQLSTNWMLLQKQVGDAGFFDSIKEQLKTINDYLKSDEARKYAQLLGEGMKTALDSFSSLAKTISENKEEIASLLKVMGEFWLLMKAGSIAGKGGGMLGELAMGGGFIGNLKDQWRSHRERLDEIKKDTEKRVMRAPTNWSMGRISPVDQIVDWPKQTGAMKKYTLLAAEYIGALAGPIGAVGAGMALLVSQYIEFTNKAKKSLEDVAKRQKELDQRKYREPGSAALQTRDDIDEKIANVKELQKKIADLDKARDRSLNSLGPLGSTGLDKEIKLNQELIDQANKAIGEGLQNQFDRRMSEMTSSAQSAIQDVMEKRTTSYKQQMDLVNKEVDAVKKAGDKTIDVEKFKHDKVVSIMKSEVDGRLEIVKNMMDQYQAILDEQVAKSPELRLFNWNQQDLKSLDEQKTAIMDVITTIQAKISQTSDEPTKSELLKELTGKQKELDQVKEKIDNVVGAQIALKKSGAITPEQLVKFTESFAFLEQLSAWFKKLIGQKNELSEGKLVGDDAIGTEAADKEQMKKDLQEAQNLWEQHQAKLASMTAKYMMTHTSAYEKLATKTGTDLSETLNKTFAKLLDEGDPSIRLSENMEKTLRSTREMLDKDNEAALMGAENDSVRTQNYIGATQFVAELIGRLDEEISERQKLNPLLDEQLKLQDELSRQYAIQNTGIDPGRVDDQKVKELEREREQLIQLGQDVAAVEERLAVARQNSSDKALIEDLKKSHEEYKRIKQEEKDSFEQTDEFKRTFQEKTLKELIQAQAEFNADGSALYKKSIDDQVEEIKKRAREEYGTYDESLNKFVAAERDKLEAMMRITDKMKAENVKRESSRSLRESALGRDTSITSEERGVRSATNFYQDRVDDIQRSVMGPEEKNAQMQDALQSYIDKIQQVKYEHRSAFEQMMQETVSFKQIAGDAATTFTDGMLDGITMLMTEGTANFRKFAASVLQDIGRMLIKMALLKAAQMAFSFFGGGAGATAAEAAGQAAGQATGSPFIGVGPYQSFGNQEFGGVVTPFADGGMMSQSDMDKGGVRKTPHLALFAEAGVPEAFIPMHDGKNIPISLVRDASGKLTASALLPGGRSIPAKIAESNVTAFATGGIMGGSSGVQTGITVPDAMSDFVSAITDASARVRGIEGSQSQRSDNSNLKSSGGDNISFTIQINNEQGDQKSKDMGDKKEIWGKMSEKVKQVVSEELIKQKRPGGLLWEPK